MLFYIILLVLPLAAVLFLFILYPFIYILLLKIKFGKKAIIIFQPFQEFIIYLIKSEINEQDALLNLKNKIKQNKNAELILSNVGYQPFIIFLKPQDYKNIMINSDLYTKLRIIPDKFKNRIMLQGLLFSDGERWKQQRVLLGKSFVYEELLKNIPLINQTILERVNLLKKNNEQQVILQQFIPSILGEIVLKMFFGDEIKNKRFNGQAASQYILDTLYQLLKISRDEVLFYIKFLFFGQLAWILFPSRNQRQIYDNTSNMIQNITSLIDERLKVKQKALEEGQILMEQDFLDIHLNLLINQEQKKIEKKITFDEIIQQSFTMIIAGTDTTSTLISNAIYFLIKYPKIQEELYQEIIEIYGQQDNFDHSLLKNQGKMSSFLNECLRSKPIAFSLLPRRVLKQHQIKGITLKKGWFVNYVPFGTTENDDYFDKSDQFNFKRWIGGNPLNSQYQNETYAFIPFSAGPRNCIGQHLAQIESKLILSHLIRNFIFESQEREPIWKIQLVYGVDDKYKVSIRKRSS